MQIGIYLHLNHSNFKFFVFLTVNGKIRLTKLNGEYLDTTNFVNFKTQMSCKIQPNTLFAKNYQCIVHQINTPTKLSIHQTMEHKLHNN